MQPIQLDYQRRPKHDQPEIWLDGAQADVLDVIWTLTERVNELIDEVEILKYGK